MKLKKVIYVCVAGAIVSLGTGYSAMATQEIHVVGQSDVKAESIEEGAETEGFKLSISSKKKNYELGEGISLDATFEDVNREKVEVRGRGTYLTYALEITRPDGTLAPLSETGKKNLKMARRSSAGAGHVMNPGSKQEILIDASPFFDMTQTGEYSLQVSRQVPSLKDPKKMVTIYSNVVKITVGEPEETAEDDSAATIEDEPEK